MLQEVKTMLHFKWEIPEVPEYDPEIHNPERVFALLCYRGIHYAKWVYLDVFKPVRWNLKNPRKEG
tara:strand:- start:172 stop:369 length:198 start_codon:yes stop_codon:yes gene_type:complete